MPAPLRMADRLDWLHLGDQAVVFNPRSGDTHLLNLVERTALACLDDPDASEPAGHAGITLEELTRRVAAALDIDADEQLRRYLDELIHQFDELGLIATP